ncbi:MAG TPA: HlyD family secretion protein [Kofleriaceae bacterium]|jgi:membrane fusion protein (multidrug efflux system)
MRREGGATGGEGGDSPVPPLDKAPVPPKKRKALFVFVGLVVVAAGIAAWIYFARLGKEKTDDAQVEAHISNVAPRITGQVKKVLVEDNQPVKAGDVLIELDDREQQARVAAAKADLAANMAQLRMANTQASLTEKTSKANLAIARGGIDQAQAVSGSTQANIDQAKANVVAAESHATFAKEEHDRATRLNKDGALAKAELDARAAADDQAQAQLAQSKAALASAVANRSNVTGTETSARGKLLAADTVDEQVEAAKAQVALAEAHVSQSQTALDRAQLDLDYTKVRAEMAGNVTKRSVEPGQTVSPDRALMAIVDLSDTWVIANLKETQLDDIKPGQAVDIEVDSFSGEFHGKVDSIAAGTGSRFSLLPPENASGNFIKVTQRVPVKIKLDDRAGRVLRPGMSCDVVIHTK